MGLVFLEITRVLKPLNPRCGAFDQVRVMMAVA